MQTIEQATILDVADAVRRSWTAETSYDPNVWTPEVPSTGQCAVTALVLETILGGTIVRAADTFGASHYWNVIDGEVVDLTLDQFQTVPVWTVGPEVVESETLLTNENTRRRFLVLMDRVNRHVC